MNKNDTSSLIKWVSAYGYCTLTNILLPLQLGLLVFSLLYSNSFLFFLCFKTFLAISILLLLVEHKKPSKQEFYDMLVILPGMWAALYGILLANPGVYYEIPVYLLAPISYLIVLRFSSLSFLKLVMPILKFACAINILVFFFLYFSKGGELYAVLQHYTRFIIHQLDGFNKVSTLQATPLIFLLPVFLIHFYFKKNTINFILVAGCVLMALLIGRKAILIMLVVFELLLLLYALYKRRNLISIITLVSPAVVAMAVFSQISSFETEKFADAMFNSFPPMQPSEYALDSMEIVPSFLGKKSLQARESWESLYLSPDNVCSRENTITLSKSSDKIGAVMRQNQMRILIHQIALSPWLGHGLGYIVPQCIRSVRQPWRFEITYLGIVMNIGLLGLFLYGIVYLRWLTGAICSSMDKSVCFPLVGGSLFFLICAATNPYIMSVEHLWIFFLPYLLVQIESRGKVELTTKTSEKSMENVI
jgi:hypothetical protein